MSEESSRPPRLDWRTRLSGLGVRAKLALIVNLLLLIVVVTFAFVFEHRQRIAIIQEVEKRAVVMAEVLAGRVESGQYTLESALNIAERILYTTPMELLGFRPSEAL